MKRFFRILGRFFLVLLVLLVALWILIQTPFFQDWMGHIAARKLSKGLKTTVKIDHVSFRLLNTFSMEGVYIEDQNKDTLLTAGLLQVNITDWFFAQDSTDLKYIRLKDVNAHLYRNDSVWNYQFIVDYFGPGSAKKDSTPPLALHLKVVDLENIHVRQSDRWRGKYMVGGVGKLHMIAEQISFRKGVFDIATLSVERPEYRELKRKGLWSAEDSIRYWTRPVANARPDTVPKEINPNNTFFEVRSLSIKDGVVEFFNRQTVPSEPGVFDARDILVTGITGTAKNVKLSGDTLNALVDLQAKERSGINLKRLHTQLHVDSHIIELAKLDLQMNNSRLGDYYAMHFNSIDDMDEFIDSVRISAHFENSTVSIPDIGFFAPLLKSRKQTVQMSGNANGTVSDFVLTNVDIRTGKSRITGSYSMRGLIDINNTQINFNTANTQVALEDVAVWAPEVLSLNTTPVGKLGVVTFKGNYAGTVYDFRVKGTLNSAVGNMTADFKLKMAGTGQGYDGVITNANFKGGELLGVPDLGNLKFHGTISSNGFATSNPINIKGTIEEGEYHGYTYNNIYAEAQLQNNRLMAGLSMSDVNLAGHFETILDFNTASRRYNGRGIVTTADLKALGFVNDSLTFSGEFDVDFKGKTIDDFLGYARFYNAQITKGRTPLSFDSLLLASSIDTSGIKLLTLHTNEADIAVEGKFNISDLGNSFQYFLSRYYPALISPPKYVVTNQDLKFDINTREVEPFLFLVDKNLRGLNYSKLSGTLNTADKVFMLNLNVPFFGYDRIGISNIAMNGKGNQETLALDGSVDNVVVNDSLNFPNVVLNLNTYGDSTHLLLNTSTQGPLGDARLDATLITGKNSVEAIFNESSFIVNNKKWTIDSTGNFAMRDGFFISSGISLHQDQQRVALSTHPSEEGNWNNINIDVENLIVGDLLPYVLSNPRLEGIATGKVQIIDPKGNMHVSANLDVDQFRFNNDSIGTVKLAGQYNGRTKKLTSTIESPNDDYAFTGKLDLDLNDSADVQINTVMPIKHMRVNILKSYLVNIFDDIDGYASGNLQLVGKLGAPAILGDVVLTEGSIKVGYTKCVYKVDSAVLHFGDNYIDFGKMKIKDDEGRKGLVEGRFYHRFFDSLSFNMRMSTDGMQVLNTSGKDNELFFGKAIAKATFDLNGPLNNLNIRITGTPTDSSHIYISNKTTRETGNADFVYFKSYGTEMEVTTLSDETNFHMDIDLNANPLCKIDVVLDEVTQDIIKAVGTGNLKIHTGTTDETTMRGRYNIESGSYNYSFQTLIRRPFTLSGDDDNYIEWTGDPADANLNVHARYQARNVSMSTLVGGSGSNTPLDQDARNAQGDIVVIAIIKGRLSSPEIGFDIDFAAGSALRNNLSAQDMVRRIKEDNSEMLRQVTYLIVFNSFAPYKEGSNIRNPGTELAVNTLSDLVSREMGKILTNVVQDITGDQSLNVDISTNFYNSSQTLDGVTTSSSTYDRVNFGFNLNKSYFNNRVVINVGSDFDLSVRNTTASGFQFLPDISVEFILTSNRRLRAILFKRDNLDIGGRRNRAGVSLSYRRDFDSFFGKRSADDDVLFGVKMNTAEN